MATLNTFVGPRILLKFPGQWVQDQNYDYMSAVYDENGQSWLSKCDVPAGQPLEEGQYWVKWDSPNAQYQLLQQTVQSFDGRITDNANSISQTNENLSNFEADVNSRATTIMCFGDSWGNGPNEWPQYLSNLSGLTLKNYCIPGESFPFLDQLNTASSEITNESDIAYAVVFGGVNNCAGNVVTNFGDWQTFLTLFNDKFPNTHLYMFALNVPSAKYFESNSVNYNNVIQTWYNLNDAISTFSYKNATIMNIGPALLSNSEDWDAVRLHPGNNESITIANKMFNVINGGTINKINLPNLDPVPSGVNVSGEAFFDAGGIHLPAVSATAASGATSFYWRCANVSTQKTSFVQCTVYDSDTSTYSSATIELLCFVYDTNSYLGYRWDTLNPALSGNKTLYIPPATLPYWTSKEIQ